jgi:hypothetical protein
MPNAQSPMPNPQSPLFFIQCKNTYKCDKFNENLHNNYDVGAFKTLGLKNTLILSCLCHVLTVRLAYAI